MLLLVADGAAAGVDAGVTAGGAGGAGASAGVQLSRCPLGALLELFGES